MKAMTMKKTANKNTGESERFSENTRWKTLPFTIAIVFNEL